MNQLNYNTIRIDILVLGSVRTNTYIVSNLKTKETVIFDPADQADQISSFLEKENLALSGIVLTHGHFDHILAVNELARRYGVKVYGQKEEEELVSSSRLNMGISGNASCKLDILLEDQQVFTLGGMEIKTIHTPGHTGGSSCYYFAEDKVLISGDTLFYESIGRTDLPTGDGATIIKSIKEKLFALDDEVAVFPGHGRSTTIGYEKLHNMYVN